MCRHAYVCVYVCVCVVVWLCVCMPARMCACCLFNFLKCMIMSLSFHLLYCFFFFFSCVPHFSVIGLHFELPKALYKFPLLLLLLFIMTVYFCLYGPFNCISFQKFSQQLSAFSLCSSDLISALLVLSTIYLFMKVSFSPDIILCGWLGLKHELTNSIYYD